MSEQTVPTLEVVPETKSKTRSRVTTSAALLIGVALVGLTIDQGIKRLRTRKTTVKADVPAAS